jgi:phosphodiesterase/alkaline phosphatase D-like protein
VTIYVLVARETEVTASDSKYFVHGVASGDPQATGLVLWTRFTPQNASATEDVPIHWKIWHDDATDTIVDEVFAIVQGTAYARAQRDFTVKVDVQSRRLQPKVLYAFRFFYGLEQSAVGKFHLPPEKGQPLKSLKYAIFSCSNWRWGYFTAYGAAAREALDFWLHLGDFIYESAAANIPNSLAVRKTLEPEHETISLQDYRQRYAFYRSDPDLQRLSAAAPMIAIWDDHEVANNAWIGGAEAHDDAVEGNYISRRAAAMRAYHEWMPTRPNADAWAEKASVTGSGAPWMKWRRLDFGDLASMLVLETRHTSRTNSTTMSRESVSERIDELLKVEGYPSPAQWPGSQFEERMNALKFEVDWEMNREEKTILGQEQLQWIESQMRSSTTEGIKWRLIAQPLVMQDRMTRDYEKAIEKVQRAGDMDLAQEWQRLLENATTSADSSLRLKVLTLLASGRYRINLSLDDWMGYSADKRRLMAALGASQAPGTFGGTVVYGGDTHNAWAGSVQDATGKVLAAEFDGMSVSSAGLEWYVPMIPPKLEAASWEAANANLVWADTHSRGFMMVSLARDKQLVEYRGVDVTVPSEGKSWCVAKFEVRSGHSAIPSRRSCSNSTVNDTKQLLLAQGASMANPSQRRHLRLQHQALLSLHGGAALSP